MSRAAALAAWVGRRARPHAPETSSPWTPEERSRLRAREAVVRWTSSRGTHVGHAAVVLGAPAAAAWRTLDDIERFPSFLPYLTAANLLEGGRPHGVHDTEVELEFTLKGHPWRYALHQRQVPGESVIPFQVEALHPSALVPGGEGRWTLSRWEEDWSCTLLTVLVELHTRSWVPGLVFDPIAARTLRQVMLRLATRVEATP